MNILHIASMSNSPFGGVSVAVNQYLAHQSQKANVAFVNIKNNIDGIPVKCFHYDNGFKIANLEEPFNRPDLIVFHEMYSLPFLSIAKEAIRIGTPYIIVPHGGLAKSAQRKKAFKKVPANILFHSFYKHAAAFHYLTPQERNCSILKKYKSFVVPNGIDGKKIILLDKKTHIVFSFIGRMDVFYKGIDLLLAGINVKKKLVREHNAIFKLYGPSKAEDLKLITDLISKYQISDIVLLMGPVLDNKKRDALLGSTFFIQTSRSEGLPMGIIEAMSYSVPCCLSSGTNLANIVEEYKAGFTCRSEPNSIGEMIEKALNCDNYLELCRQSHKIVEDLYDWDIVVEHLLSEYQKIIDTR